MIDEVTDLANIKQVILIIHLFNDNLTVTEDFISLYKTESIESSSLVSIIKDVLLWMNRKLKYCRGQCYDGASNMTGKEMEWPSSLLMKNLEQFSLTAMVML